MRSDILKWQLSPEERLAAITRFDAIREESLRIEEERRSAAKLEQLLQKVPLCYRSKTLDDFKIDYPEQAKIKKIVERYVLTFTDRLKEGTGLVFMGKHGTGKTMLSLIIYQMLAKTGVRVSYEPSLRFLRLLQEKSFESHAAFDTILDYYRYLPLLMIDEATEGFAGKGGALSEWEKQMLFTLVNVRYQANLCTLMMSNRTKQEWLQRLGEGVMDRIAERNLILAFNWHSYRQAVAERQGQESKLKCLVKGEK